MADKQEPLLGETPTTPWCDVCRAIFCRLADVFGVTLAFFLFGTMVDTISSRCIEYGSEIAALAFEFSGSGECSTSHNTERCFETWARGKDQARLDRIQEDLATCYWHKYIFHDPIIMSVIAAAIVIILLRDIKTVIHHSDERLPY